MSKVAVLEVAINKYGGGNDLRGCRQDMLDRRAFLSELGLQTVETRELTDQHATLNAIRYGIGQLFLVKADGYFLHLSGHGTGVRDLSGDERIDFGFVPYGWEQDGFLLDDEIAELLKKAPEKKFVGVFVDACHSESGQRGFFKFPVPRVPNAIDIKPRVLHSAKHTKQALQATRRRKELLPPKPTKGLLDWFTKRRSGSTGVLFTDTCLYWGAAQSDKTADDAFIHNLYRGAGTFYQIAAYRQLKIELRGQQPTWEQINRRGNELLRRNGHQHRMQLDGRKEVVCREASIL